MAREHPQGAARHVGAQVRYLILSRHGCLGAFGFAASALMLAARDRWIGWDWSGDDLVDGGDCVIGRVVFD